MTKKKILILTVLTIGISVILVFSLLIGYSDYRGYTFRNTFSSCSFEYPRFHRVISVEQPNEDSPIARVFIALIQLKSTKDESITITIREVNSLTPSYNSLIEYELNTLRTTVVNTDVKILETANFTIDGISGERKKYLYIRPDVNNGDSDQLMLFKGTPKYLYSAYFENNGFIWVIKVEAIASRVKQAEKDFNHIIDTFTILE
jgi:hypothetical protein